MTRSKANTGQLQCNGIGPCKKRTIRAVEFVGEVARKMFKSPSIKATCSDSIGRQVKAG